LISVLPRLFRRYGWVATSALTLGEPIGPGQISRADLHPWRGCARNALTLSA
jgi:hypothetical protein